MNYDYGINQGTYLIQSGYRSSIGLIQCPYISGRIQVNDAHELQVLDGAQVFWREIKKFYIKKKNTHTQETIILAQIIGLKHCKYMMGGINIIATLELQNINGQVRLIGRPINKKIPNLEVIDFEGHPATYTYAIPQLNKMTQYYYWVQIVAWSFGQKYPKACVTAIFNRGKSAQSQTQAILHSLQIDQRQSKLILQSNVISSSYLPISNHKKFNQIVFTIDPQDCVDMEDALSITKIQGEIYQVGVHIADVSSFMNLVDRKQLKQRGTSFYLPHKTVQLFPKIITQLCSFQPKKQRLSFSVFLKMNQNGDILDTRFEKTIIQSIVKLTYQQAQQILQTQQLNFIQFSTKHSLSLQQSQQISLNIKILKIIAFNRRKVRKSQDVLDRNQITFDLDKYNIPIRIGIKKRFDSQRLIQQFMIATNGQVAKKLVQDFGSNALLIHHPKPSQHNINNLNTLFSDFGVRFKNDSIISLENQVKKLFEKQGVKDQFKQALMMRAIQIQQLAVYSRHKNSQKGHYGLNMQYYTHFTSPLRRFADIITHEQLTNCIDNGTQKQKYNRILDEQIQWANRARLKNKKLKQYIVQGFLNLYLYQNKQKIIGKAMAMCLGLKSVTLYLPFYNLIKEVYWNHPVQSSGKDAIVIKYINKMGRVQEKQISKNDSIDIEMQFDVHQQIKITMMIKGNSGEVLKI